MKDFIFNHFSHPVWLKPMIKNDLLVLVYHDVNPYPCEFSKKYNLNVEPRVFEKQIQFLKNNFHMISPQELAEGNFSTPACLVSFDDGFIGYFDYAVPILSELKVPSIIFLNMAPVSGEIFWSGFVHYLIDFNREFSQFLNVRLEGWPHVDFLYVTEKLVREFYNEKGGSENDLYQQAIGFYGGFVDSQRLESASRNPLVWYGNHLYNHYNSARLSQEEFIKNYRQNRERLLGYPNYIDFFSYPYGQPQSCFTHATNRWLGDLGPQRVFTAFPAINSLGKNKSEKWMYHRISVDNSVSSSRDMWCNISKSVLRSYLKGKKSLLLEG